MSNLIEKITQWLKNSREKLPFGSEENKTLVNTLLTRLKKRPLEPSIINHDELTSLQATYAACEANILQQVENNASLSTEQKELITVATQDSSYPQITNDLHKALNAMQGLYEQFEALWDLKNSILNLQNIKKLDDNVKEINDIIASDQQTMNKNTLLAIVDTIHHALKENNILQVLESFYDLEQYLTQTLGIRLLERKGKNCNIQEYCEAVFNACNTWISTDITITDREQWAAFGEVLATAYQAGASVVDNYYEVDKDLEAYQILESKQAKIVHMLNGFKLYQSMLDNRGEEKQINYNSQSFIEKEKSVSSNLTWWLHFNTDSNDYIKKFCQQRKIATTTKSALITDLLKNTPLLNLNKEIFTLFENASVNDQKDCSLLRHQFQQDVFDYQIRNVSQVITWQKNLQDEKTDTAQILAAQKAFVHQIQELIRDTKWKINLLGGERINVGHTTKVLPHHVATIFKKCQELNSKNDLTEESWQKAFAEIATIGKQAASQNTKYHFLGFTWEKRNKNTQSFYEKFENYQKFPSNRM